MELLMKETPLDFVQLNYSLRDQQAADRLLPLAAEKGIAVIGTGDFTHPAWFAELEAKLRPAEPGLFRLPEETERAIADRLPVSCRGATRFSKGTSPQPPTILALTKARKRPGVKE